MKKPFLIFLLVFGCTIHRLYAQKDEKTVILDTVFIEGKAYHKINHVATTYIDKNEIAVDNPRDIGEYLRIVPNVSGIRKGGSAIDPVVRGFKYSQLNVILNNGVKIENGCPNRMDPVSSHIEAEDIDNIEVIKGPFSLRYGPAFGGVINLISPYPQSTEKFEVHANAMYGYESNWNGNKLHGTVSAGNKNIQLLLSGGYRNYGNYKSGANGDLEGKDTVYSSAFKKYNYLAKLGFSINPGNKLTFSYDAVHGRDVMYPALPMDEKSDDTHFISIDYSVKKLSPSLNSLDVKIYRSMVNHVMDNSYRPNYSTMQMVADVDADNTGGNAVMNFGFTKSKLLVGVDFENIAKDGRRVGTMTMMGTSSTKITNLWKEALIRNTGLFAEYRFDLPRYEFNVNVRGDINNATSEDTLKIIENGVEYFNDVNSDFFNVSAGVAITREFNEWFNVSLALASGTRSPNMLERYIKLMPVGYDRYDYLGNPQLKPETNNEIDLTFRIDRGTVGSIYLNFFYSYVKNYITANLLPASVITPQTQGVLGVKQFANTDYITNRGFEFGYKSPENYKLGGNAVAAYTYGVIPSVTKYVITNSQVTDAIEIENDALSEIPPFEATFDVYYKILNGDLMPMLTLRTVAAQRHISEAFYEQFTPGFWLMNISLTYKLNKHARLNMGIKNIFDKAYYEHLNRRIIGTTNDLFEPGRVFFMTLTANI